MFFQSLIIVNKKKSREELIEEVNSMVIPSPDKNYELIIDLKDSKISIGIKDVKEIINWNALASESPRVGYIFNSNLLTIPAQNMLLKIIEEPNPYSQIVFITSNKDDLLETITSRCKIIEIKDNNFDENYEIESFIKLNYLEMKKMIYNISQNRNDFIDFIESLLKINKKESLNSSNKNYNMLELLEKWQFALKSNVNTKLVANSVLLHLSQYE